MCTHRPASSTSISRRDLLRAGAVALAAGVVLPRVSQAQAEDLTRIASSAPRSDLDVALAAERWIRRARVETPHGVTWPADPLKPASIEYDLYNGMPGVVLFYLELYAATGDKAWLSEARAGSDELATHVAEMERTENAGLYTGLAGAAFVLEETFHATGDGRYRDAAKRAIDGIHHRAQRVGRGSGATWSGESATNDIISGNAGIGLFLLWADQRLPDPRNRETAIAAGRHLLDNAIP